MEQDRKEWAAKGEKEKERENEFKLQIQKMYESFAQKSLSRFMDDSTVQEWEPDFSTLTDLENFGKKFSEYKESFRWPTQKDL